MPKHHTTCLPIAIEPERPIGRPTLYRPQLCDQIIAAMGEGLSLEAAAAACGIGPRTVFTWQTQHDDFRQAVEEGRTKSLLFWERRAIALSKGEAGNAAVITLGLKNRSRAASGWHDAQRLEHSGPDGGIYSSRSHGRWMSQHSLMSSWRRWRWRCWRLWEPAIIAS
jgi:hypothetical protein